jgi:hypothetical protein
MKQSAPLVLNQPPARRCPHTAVVAIAAGAHPRVPAGRGSRPASISAPDGCSGLARGDTVILHGHWLSFLRDLDTNPTVLAVIFSPNDSVAPSARAVALREQRLHPRLAREQCQVGLKYPCWPMHSCGITAIKVRSWPKFWANSASLSLCAASTAGRRRGRRATPRVRPNRRFRHKGTDSLSESGIKGMRGGTARRCG